MSRHDQRYERAVKILEENPAVQLVMLTDPDDESGLVIIGIARRDVAYVELSCTHEQYKPFDLLALFKRHTGDIEENYPVPIENKGTAYEQAIRKLANPDNSATPADKKKHRRKS